MEAEAIYTNFSETPEQVEWDPFRHRVVEGEENQYNHTYDLIEGEEQIFKKYNIEKEGLEYFFKSCGLFANYKPESNTFNIDFTPFSAKHEGLVNENSAIALGYRAFINLQHAIEEEELQISNQETIQLKGYTNPTMAKIALKMGFKIEVAEEMIDLNTLKNQKIKLEKSGYHVEANMHEVIARMQHLEERGISKRLVLRYKPQDYIDEDALDSEDELVLGTSTLARIRGQ